MEEGQIMYIHERIFALKNRLYEVNVPNYRGSTHIAQRVAHILSTQLSLGLLQNKEFSLLFNEVITSRWIGEIRPNRKSFL